MARMALDVVDLPASRGRATVRNEDCWSTAAHRTAATSGDMVPLPTRSATVISGISAIVRLLGDRVVCCCHDSLSLAKWLESIRRTGACDAAAGWHRPWGERAGARGGRRAMAAHGQPPGGSTHQLAAAGA